MLLRNVLFVLWPVDPTIDGLTALQVLLRADKGVEKFSDRTILKNLGHWLGLMTIAKSKPILQASLLGFRVSSSSNARVTWQLCVLEGPS